MSHLIPLNSEQHGALKLRRQASFAYAAGYHAAALAKAEILKAALTYPVLFSKTEAGFQPVALLGLVPGENQFVRGDAWQAPYIPAAMRVYPFRLAGEQVLIDASAPHFANPKEGEALFTESGGPTPVLNQALDFLRACHAEEASTQAWCARLAELDLLVEQGAEVLSPAGTRYRLTGFYVVDPARLSALNDGQLAELVRDGSLARLHAHQMSLENLVSLAALRDGAKAPEAASAVGVVAEPEVA